MAQRCAAKGSPAAHTGAGRWEGLKPRGKKPPRGFIVPVAVFAAVGFARPGRRRTHARARRRFVHPSPWPAFPCPPSSAPPPRASSCRRKSVSAMCRSACAAARHNAQANKSVNSVTATIATQIRPRPLPPYCAAQCARSGGNRHAPPLLRLSFHFVRRHTFSCVAGRGARKKNAPDGKPIRDGLGRLGLLPAARGVAFRPCGSAPSGG